MTTTEVIKLLPIIQALSEGKVVQFRTGRDQNWYDLAKDSYFNWNIDSYRIKPTPQPPIYRPWRPEEVPIGAIIKHDEDIYGSVLTHITMENILNIYKAQFAGSPYPTGTSIIDMCTSNREFKYSLDKGVTWLPCGVLVSDELVMFK